MKRYLVRSPFDPLNIKEPDCSRYMWKKFAGGNSGNIVYAYGVMNALQTEDTQIEYTYKTSFSDEEIEKINSTYDALILPLADAFRVSWQKQLKSLTGAIRKMRIPVVVIGVAVRADYEPDFSEGFEFDSLAADFVRAVTATGTVLGLRGEITGRYLEHLGFKEGEDFIPIGCPSLYTYGMAVKTRELSEKPEKLVMNTNGYYDVGRINEFLLNTAKAMPGYYLVQQHGSEFRDMYLGRRWFPLLIKKGLNRKDKAIIKGDALQELYRQDRVRFFFDVTSWINYMKGFDLAVGSRFHGSVAAILAGNPHVILPFNARTRELSEYHHLTSLKPGEIKSGTSVLDYLDKLDFGSFYSHQEENLKRYVQFLKENGLENIFEKKQSYEYGESPLEKMIQSKMSVPMSEYCFIVHDYESLGAAAKLSRAASANIKGLNPKNLRTALRLDEPSRRK